MSRREYHMRKDRSAPQHATRNFEKIGNNQRRTDSACPMLLKVAIVESRNEDKKITNFLQDERRQYESMQLEKISHPVTVQNRKSKEKKRDPKEESETLKRK